MEATQPAAAGPRILDLGRRPFAETLAQMMAFTDARAADTPDEIWLVQHEPVYTLGMGGRPEHLLDVGDVPVVRTDRGGQVTYHGPGQVIAYVLLDLRRRGMGVRTLVTCLEQAVIDLAGEWGIEAARRPGAPGVYVSGRKLAALGLRVRRGCSYHGLAVNVDMDLAPFSGINPCGYPGLEVTCLRQLGVDLSCREFAQQLARGIVRALPRQESGPRPGRAVNAVDVAVARG